jgi:hypothetical protein
MGSAFSRPRFGMSAFEQKKSVHPPLHFPDIKMKDNLENKDFYFPSVYINKP